MRELPQDDAVIIGDREGGNSNGELATETVLGGRTDVADTGLGGISRIDVIGIVDDGKLLGVEDRR